MMQQVVDIVKPNYEVKLVPQMESQEEHKDNLGGADQVIELIHRLEEVSK